MFVLVFSYLSKSHNNVLPTVSHVVAPEFHFRVEGWGLSSRRWGWDMR